MLWGLMLFKGPTFLTLMPNLAADIISSVGHDSGLELELTIYS